MWSVLYVWCDVYGTCYGGVRLTACWWPYVQERVQGSRVDWVAWRDESVWLHSLSLNKTWVEGETISLHTLHSTLTPQYHLHLDSHLLHFFRFVSPRGFFHIYRSIRAISLNFEALHMEFLMRVETYIVKKLWYRHLLMWQVRTIIRRPHCHSIQLVYLLYMLIDWQVSYVCRQIDRGVWR